MQQASRAGFDDAHILLLLRIQRRRAQIAQKTDDAVQRRTDLMAHLRQKELMALNTLAAALRIPLQGGADVRNVVQRLVDGFLAAGRNKLQAQLLQAVVDIRPVPRRIRRQQQDADGQPHNGISPRQRTVHQHAGDGQSGKFAHLVRNLTDLVRILQAVHAEPGRLQDGQFALDDLPLPAIAAANLLQQIRLAVHRLEDMLKLRQLPVHLLAVAAPRQFHQPMLEIVRHAKIFRQFAQGGHAAPDAQQADDGHHHVHRPRNHQLDRQPHQHASYGS